MLKSVYFIRSKVGGYYMASKALASPLYKFFEDKNQLLLSLPTFCRELGNFSSDVWFWRDTKGSISKQDYSILKLSHFKLIESPQVNINGETYAISSQKYAKLFVLALMSKSTEAPYAKFQMIVHLIAFLNRNEDSVLSSVLLESFWNSFLTESVSQNGFSNRLVATSYRGAINSAPLARARNTLQSWNVSGVIDNRLSPKRIEIALDESCQSALGMTLSEYKIGGSFNFLGLELGQYYVDYLRQVCQQDYFYSLVCKKTIKDIHEKFKINEITRGGQKTYIFNVILAALKGKEFQRKRTMHILHHELYRATFELALEHYQTNFYKVMALNEVCIEKLVLKLGLGARFDAVEVIRVLMLQKYHAFGGHKKPKDVWTNYLTSLEKTFLDSKRLANIAVDDVYEMMQEVVLEEKQDEKMFFNSLHFWVRKRLNRSSAQTYEKFVQGLNQVNYAMASLVVAWLGYRKSEFGFPLSAIKTKPNLDILDSSHVPFRFYLKWFVPKTNEMVKIDREITSQCYQVAAQLNELFDVTDDSPCLYEYNGTHVNQDKRHQSGSFIVNRVAANWGNFINEYQPFNDVIRLEMLSQKAIESLSEGEKKEYRALNDIYNANSPRFKHLYEISQKVNTDWKVLSVTNFNGNKAGKYFKVSLDSFIKTGLIENEHHKEVIENHLSAETKFALRSGMLTLDIKTMKDIYDELKEGKPYPTPHAFRHIWAEAVLTRYQGNVGAVIRHQFCHLDGSFFMRYLRTKEVNTLMDGARQRYLNSIVEMLLEDSNNIGTDYVGGCAVFIKKAKNLIQPRNKSELRILNEQINARVIHHQQNRFADCLPREGSEHRAKCYRFGRMNTQDAKPEFCLLCINALITVGHIKGVWQTIQPMVIQCLDDNMMGFMIEDHLPTLKSAYKRIRDLRSSAKNKDSVDKILSIIIDAINTVELKLKEEAQNYD